MEDATAARTPLRRDPTRRELLAARIADELDRPIAALGLIWVLVVLAQTLANEGSALATWLEAAGWLLWALFVFEFVLRMVIAPSTRRFLRANWWQVIFLAVPFLRFLRLARVLRLARAGRIVTSAIRSSRTARRALSDRVGWLLASTAIVILSGSQLLYEYAGFASYGAALQSTALLVVVGEPIGRAGVVAALLEFILAVYSVVVVASLAAILGAFFVERRSAAASAAP